MRWRTNIICSNSQKLESHGGKMSTQSVPFTHQDSKNRLYFEEFGIINKIINPQANIKWSHENSNKIALKSKDGFLMVLNIVRKLFFFHFNFKMYAHSHIRSVAFSYPSLLVVFSLLPPSLSLPLLSMSPHPLSLSSFLPLYKKVTKFPAAP